MLPPTGEREPESRGPTTASTASYGPSVALTYSAAPTRSPSFSSGPSSTPISGPTSRPISIPTAIPSSGPSFDPSVQPTSSPSLSSSPTEKVRMPKYTDRDFYFQRCCDIWQWFRFLWCKRCDNQQCPAFDDWGRFMSVWLYPYPKSYC